MNIAEAIAAAQWQRVTGAHMQPGCYVLRDNTSGELHRFFPSGSHCTFVVNEYDVAAEWCLLDSGWQGA